MQRATCWRIWAVPKQHPPVWLEVLGQSQIFNGIQLPSEFSGINAMITFDLLRREPDIRKYRQGETIFKQGDAADCMFAVVEGAIDIELEGAVIERVLPVTVFGEMALIDALPRSATARAASDCSLAVVDQQRFLRLVELTPYFALHMMQLITARLRRVNPH